MAIVLEISGRLDGLNEYTRACRSKSWQAGAEMKKRNEAKVISCILNQLKDVYIDYPVTVEFVWFEKDSRRDLDNIAFAKKFILDAMVKTGTLKDDSQKYIQGFTDTVFTHCNPSVRVIFKKAGDGIA